MSELRFYIVFIIILVFYRTSFGQMPEQAPPIYYKVISQQSDAYWNKALLVPHKDYARYFLNWHSPNTELDVGIFDTNITTNLNTDLNQKIFFLDQDLNFSSDLIQININPYNTTTSSTNPIGYSNNYWYFYTAMKFGTTNFDSQPPFINQSDTDQWQKSIFSYNQSSEEINLLFTLNQAGFSGPAATTDFGLVSGITEIKGGHSDQFQAYQFSNGTIIATFLATSNMEIQGNWESNFDSELGIYRYGFTQAIINPSNDLIEIHKTINPSGESIHKRFYPAKYNNDAYRIMISRGDSILMSRSSEIPVYFENDSLYRVLLVKDDIQGETLWYKQIFGFNNSHADSESVTPWQFRMSSSFTKILDFGTHLFAGDRYYSYSTNNDTLFWVDPFGTEHFPIPQESFGNLSQSKNLMRSSIMKLDSTGVVERQLVYDELPHFNQIALKTNPEIFEVNDFIVWKIPFVANTSTTINLSLNIEDGENEIFSFDVPIGTWNILIWLNHDLEVLDNWNIEYETSVNYSEPFDIVYIAPYNQDTLLIQGNFPPGTNTSLDPTGQSETQYYGNPGTFFAFYHFPSNVNTSITHFESKGWQLTPFPNPVSNQVQFYLPPQTSGIAAIYDVSGNLLISKKVSFDRDKLISIDTSRLVSGLYFISVNTNLKSTTAKFVKL